MIYKIIKRGFDLTSSLLLLIAISPLMVVLAVMVRIKLGRPVFFRQIRTGKNMREFPLYKFRSMTNARNAQGELLSDSERMTRFGIFLRSSSLDELPELFNIIKGDMSVIGPRPLLPKYNQYYYPGELERFNVRPGLVTPGSVDPNPNISWDKQFRYEAAYARNLSFRTDLKIFYSVFGTLLRRSESNYGATERKSLCKERADILTSNSPQ